MRKHENYRGQVRTESQCRYDRRKRSSLMSAPPPKLPLLFHNNYLSANYVNKSVSFELYRNLFTDLYESKFFKASPSGANRKDNGNERILYSIHKTPPGNLSVEISRTWIHWRHFIYEIPHSELWVIKVRVLFIPLQLTDARTGPECLSCFCSNRISIISAGVLRDKGLNDCGLILAIKLQNSLCWETT